MVIFLLGEDRAYLSWLAHHRNGFVLDWLRKPTRKRPKVHRASCAEIKSSPTKKTHWTTGRHLKVCSLDVDEILEWAREESGGDPEWCEACRPADPDAASSSPDRHLTKLGKEIVDYVVEAAVIHLDRNDQDYNVTLSDVAQYLDKTPRQVSPGLTRLVEDGYLRLSDPAGDDGTLKDDCRVLPTSDALRTLPAFSKLPKRTIEAELDSLSEEE